jgi:hypothetical protein
MTEGAAPAAEGSAGEILFLLTAPHPHGMGLGANGLAPETRLKERFLETGDWKEADYEPAMQKIIEQGWVKRVSDRIRLTEDGHNIYQVSSRSGNSRS